MVWENAATLVCCEAPEIFCELFLKIQVQKQRPAVLWRGRRTLCHFHQVFHQFRFVMKVNPHLVADRIIPLNSETDLCNMFIYSCDENIDLKLNSMAVL